MMWIWWFILIVYFLMSAWTLLMFAFDKRAARLDQRRVPEKKLHQLEMWGGWPGALIGLHLVRHKRRKSEYTRVLYTISALHCLGLMCILWITF
jgi:uncharacterized membrane protein YsdA (DUF1294 family)